MKYIFYFIIYCLLLLLTIPLGVGLVIMTVITWEGEWIVSLSDLLDLWWDYMFND